MLVCEHPCLFSRIVGKSDEQRLSRQVEKETSAALRAELAQYTGRACVHGPTDAYSAGERVKPIRKFQWSFRTACCGTDIHFQPFKEKLWALVVHCTRKSPHIPLLRRRFRYAASASRNVRRARQRRGCGFGLADGRHHPVLPRHPFSLSRPRGVSRTYALRLHLITRRSISEI